MNLQVKPENRPKFEATALKWHRLVKIIGWDDLCDMYVRQVAPFQSVKSLKGDDKTKRTLAKQILLNEMVQELKESGLEVIK